MATRAWHLLPRGVAADPAPQLIWVHRAGLRLHTAADRCQGEEGQWPHPGQKCQPHRHGALGRGALLCSGTSPYVAQLQGCQLSCHAWCRALPTLQCGTAGTAQHCWELSLFSRLPGALHPHCMRPTRRRPTALVCPTLPDTRGAECCGYSPGCQRPPYGPALDPALSQGVQRCWRGAGWAGWLSVHPVPPAPPSAHPQAWLREHRAVRAPSPVVPVLALYLPPSTPFTRR